MSVFNEFFKKEKPVFTGLKFGFGSGGAASLVPGSTLFDETWASGGVVGDYEDSGSFYRVHVFVEPGTFAVSDSQLTGVEYLVVGGGGGGGGGIIGSDGQGGGGAGGLRSNHSSMPGPLKAAAYPVTPGNYDVVVGDGGHGGLAGQDPFSQGEPGSNSYFTRNGVSHPNTQYVLATGGGGGGSWTGTASDRGGDAGGSGGGGAGGSADGTGGTGNPSDPNHPKPQGNPGGQRGPNASSGGGGGFIDGGPNSNAPGEFVSGRGGAGHDLDITGTSLGYAGGGGGGGVDASRNPPGGIPAGAATHGGGQGAKGNNSSLPSYIPVDINGRVASGGGGGGGCSSASPMPVWPSIQTDQQMGGHGGPGIVAVSYQIPKSAGTATATGGVVTFTPTSVVHTFYEPGTWTKNSVSTVDILVVGGGGGGGGMNAAGGGAGALHYKSGHSVPGDSTFAITVGLGGRGMTGSRDASGSEYGYGEPGNDTTTGNFGITAAGGGGGGTNAPQNAGRAGGSGGGGADQASGGTGSGDSGHPGAADQASPPNGWGNDGGNSGNGSSGAGGGGSRVGGGAPPGNNTGGAGGAGAEYTISGSPVTYAGGGGGGGRPSGGGGAGAAGGGDGTASSSPGFNGQIGSGSGGGGGAYVAPNWVGGGSGGPGIVIISYAKS